jgi:arsenate reductase
MQAAAPATTIVFLCTGNSARSQMAEGFARRLAPPGVKVYSAGIDPRGVNPHSIAVMAERGVDISEQWSKGLTAVPVNKADVVVTLCGEAAESCPVLPDPVRRIHWPLADPARAAGSEDEVRAVFRRIRDEIEARVGALMASIGHDQDVSRPGRS